MEVGEKSPVHRFYRDLVHRGLAFGAGRWLAAIERMCERIACLEMGSATRDLGGGKLGRFFRFLDVQVNEHFLRDVPILLLVIIKLNPVKFFQ